MKTRQEVLQIAARARAGLEKIYGSRLRGVYLYGSYARGEQNDDSDIDIAVVLDEVTDRFAERERISWLRVELGLEVNDLVSFIIVRERDFNCGSREVYRAIKREGVPASAGVSAHEPGSA
jgi:predicted nucleotidyltransferase